MAYARATKALGQCDRCDFTFKLNLLKYEIEDSKRNGFRVCTECFDTDHPQLKLGEINSSDPQTLFNARPDAGEVSSTSYYSFNPVGGGMFEFGSSTMGLNIKGDIGTVKVSTT